VFSDFGVIDPQGVPDMAVPSVPSLLLVPGPSSDSLQVGAWSVRNDGTATATNVVAQVVVAHDSMLTSGIVGAVTLGQAATLAPRDSLTGAGLAANVPADTLGGPYYVGVRVRQGGEGSLPDPSPANNVVSVRVETQRVSLGSWAERANMLSARADAASATNGSQIFVVGGIDDATGVLATGEVFDAGSGEWSALPSLAAARQDPTAGIVGNRLILAGGTMADATGEGWDFVASAMSFDLTERVWTDIAPMLVGRTEPVSGVINGRFYVAGGNTADAITGEAESYDPASNSWSQLQSMPTPRYSAGATVVNGLLYVAGGFFDQSAVPTNAFEVYDPAKNVWIVRAPLPTGRAEFCLASVDGIIYAIGGYTDGAVIRDVDAYDPRTNQWTPRAPLPVSVYAATCRSIGRTIYFVGGTDGRAVLPTVYAFTP
jgi:N-acetylneuraminic acid mutarotase